MLTWTQLCSDSPLTNQLTALPSPKRWGRLCSWIRVVARNFCYEQLREFSGDEPYEDGAEGSSRAIWTASPDTAPSEHVMARIREALDATIERALPADVDRRDRNRLLLQLLIVKEVPPDEAAVEMKTTSANARQIKSRFLREWLPEIARHLSATLRRDAEDRGRRPDEREACAEMAQRLEARIAAALGRGPGTPGSP